MQKKEYTKKSERNTQQIKLDLARYLDQISMLAYFKKQLYINKQTNTNKQTYSVTEDSPCVIIVKPRKMYENARSLPAYKNQQVF